MYWCVLVLNKRPKNPQLWDILGGSVQFSSVAQLCPTLCDPMDYSMPGFPVHHQIRVYSNSCPLRQWCHPTISSSVVPVSSCLQSFPASRSFPMSQFFASGGQNIGVSASPSVLPVNIQDWFPFGWTGWISLQSKGLSVVKKFTYQCRRDGFDPWSGSIPHAMEPLSPCATTTRA